MKIQSNDVITKAEWTNKNNTQQSWSYNQGDSLGTVASGFLRIPVNTDINLTINRYNIDGVQTQFQPTDPNQKQKAV